MLVDAFSLEGVLPISSIFHVTPRYNVAPGQPVLAVRVEPGGPAAGGRMPVMLQWGLVPSWSKDPAIGNRLINARSETAAEKPSFRAAWKRRRCLLPADAYYEWRKAAKGQPRQPFAFGLREGRPMGLAGLWEHWEGGDGSVLETCSILTTTPNAPAAKVHDRMPVILDPADYERWLDPENKDAAGLADLARPYDADAMHSWPVGTQVNNPRHDAADCLEPAMSGPEQGTLF
jgi:putative SOS response-associated peptidase YedK